jgi:hypothetical protein
MWSSLVTLVFAATLLAQEPDAKPPSPEAVKAAVAKLETAFKTGKGAERITAIREAATVVDVDVAKAIAKGLKREDTPVFTAAVEALGAMRHPEALTALSDAWTRDRELRKDDDLGGKTLKAIARHGNPKSIGLLAEDPFDSANHGAIQARILGLGNIRSKESVEALIGMMRLVGPLKVSPYMDDFRLALFVLTGHDEGRAAELWFKWWNEHKKDVTVASEAPELPRIETARWNAYWGMEFERPKPGERGKRKNRD